MQIPLFQDDYRLREKISAKARSVRIEVRAPDEVVLVYPRYVPRIEALAFLRARESWIADKRRELHEREQRNPPPPPTRWDGHDRLPLRGSEVAVRVVPASLKQISVRLEPDAITVFCTPALIHERAGAALEHALRRELQQQARSDARRTLDAEAARLGVRYSALRINDPRTLWGSCNPGGTLCLSWRLVMAPPEVFRYVAIHELCHLVHANHSARFWALVERQMPDYAQHRQWLREHGAALHRHLPSARAADADSES